MIKVKFMMTQNFYSNISDELYTAFHIIMQKLSKA